MPDYSEMHDRGHDATDEDVCWKYVKQIDTLRARLEAAEKGKAFYKSAADGMERLAKAQGERLEAAERVVEAGIKLDIVSNSNHTNYPQHIYPAERDYREALAAYREKENGK